MADFKTHLTTSTVLGIGYGAAAYFGFNAPWPSCLLAGGLCSVSGMLPDIDSDSGVPLRESIGFAAAIVPMLMLDRFRSLGWSSEMTVLAGAGIYLFIRFVVSWLVKHFTVHRGMFHSLPAAGVCFLGAFLICSGSDLNLRLFKAGGVLLGFMSHLVLDEIWSIEFTYGIPSFKKSFGTAIKFWGDSFYTNAGLARRTIGIPTPGRSTAWVDQADASSIGHFAFGYGDDNPLWHDEGYAGRTRWRGIIAPPTYLIAVGVNEAPPLDPETKALFKGLFSGLGKYYAGVDFEWWRPVVAGDVLHVERSTSDVEVKTSAFSGSRSVIETYQSLYVDRLGECVAVRRERYVSAERSGTKASGKHADLARQEWTAEGIAALDAVYEAEERRGAVSRWWELSLIHI